MIALKRMGYVHLQKYSGHDLENIIFMQSLHLAVFLLIPEFSASLRAERKRISAAFGGLLP